jgi:very-short-patch-repair endonuclease/Zn finger protein HypA/HybF involved in hydrogenase expression
MTPIKIICNKHGVFEQTPHSHRIGANCPECAIELRLNNAIRKGQNIIIDKFKKIHGDLYDYSKVTYNGCGSDVTIICKTHGEFVQPVKRHLEGGICPKCLWRSKGENIIQYCLKNQNIKYYTQKIFKDCKYKKVLRFDFYLPRYNLCIEYDGIQHFELGRFNVTDKQLQESKIKDNIKNDFCEKYNINLLRIPYWEIKNIEKLILLTISKIKYSYIEILDLTKETKIKVHKNKSRRLGINPDKNSIKIS